MSVLRKIKNEIDTPDLFFRYPYTDHSYISTIHIERGPDMHYQITVYAGGIGALFDALKIEFVGVDSLYGPESKQSLDAVVLSRSTQGTMTFKEEHEEPLQNGLVMHEGNITKRPYAGFLVKPGDVHHPLFQDLFAELKSFEPFLRRIFGMHAVSYDTFTHFSYKQTGGFVRFDTESHQAIIASGAEFSLLDRSGNGVHVQLDATVQRPFSNPADISAPIRPWFHSGTARTVVGMEHISNSATLEPRFFSYYQEMQIKIEKLYI